ncbi:MAG: hypothetical protein H0X51_01075 [Parachlamydiaceae bacterium]|nr:hypothetical protein [Parachlamydiaceae bacterium]
MASEEVWDRIENLLIEIAELQQRKLLRCGREVIPNLTTDDVLQPNDFLELEQHPVFRYEEGLLAGVHTVQMALRAFRNESVHD